MPSDPAHLFATLGDTIRRFRRGPDAEHPGMEPYRQAFQDSLAALDEAQRADLTESLERPVAWLRLLEQTSAPEAVTTNREIFRVFRETLSERAQQRLIPPAELLHNMDSLTLLLR